ncbi:MAG: flagellar filament capping protein FliD [Oscillospiraceae bacterium]|jgi:flagellar hook-associated protein 2|nr:flagellar filament capping protein FliD [Oscillospiraceae bacterium]
MAAISPLRFTGMSSGIDTDAIIKSMLQIQQLKVDREIRSRINLEWKQTGLTQINTDITDFRNTFLSVLGSKNVFSSATFNTKTASILGTDSGALTVTAGAEAVSGVYTVKSINSLASGANVTSNSTVTADGKGLADASGKVLGAKLGDLQGKFASSFSFDANNKLSFKINDKTFEFSKDDTLGTLINTVNADATANATISYDGLTDRFKLESKTTGSASTLKFSDVSGDFLRSARLTSTSSKKVSIGGAGLSDGTSFNPPYDVALKDLKFATELEFKPVTLGVDDDDYPIIEQGISFKIGNKEFAFSMDDSLWEVLATVNASSEANVKFSYDVADDRFNITSQDGSPLALFEDTNGSNFFAATELPQSTVKGGTSAQLTLTIDGNDVDVERDSNTFTANGITYKLNAVTKTDEVPNPTPIRFEVKQDVQPTIDKIKEFVTAYNSLVEKLTKLVTETKTTQQRKVTALTDADKEGMSEEEIKLVEDVAKIGLFHNDAGLSSMLSSLRNALYEKIEGTGLSPADIGLGTYGYASGSSWREKSGQIDLDVDKLKAALEKDPDAVTRMFTSVSTATDKATKYKETGFFSKITESFANYESNYRKDAVSRLTTQLSSQIQRVLDLEDKIQERSERYYKQFAAMETMITKLQSQQSSLAGLIGGSTAQ